MNEYIEFDKLNLVICKARNKRKLVNSVWAGVCFKSVPIFYGMGYIFRDKNNPKRYLTIEEVQERISNYLARASSC